MDINVTPEEYTRLSEYLSTSCGIELGDNKQYLVNSRLKAMLAKNGFKSITDLLSSVGSQGNSGLQRSFPRRLF